jgi:hypothetical protein
MKLLTCACLSLLSLPAFASQYYHYDENNNVMINNSVNVGSTSYGGNANVGSIVIDGNVVSGPSYGGIQDSGKMSSDKRDLKAFKKIRIELVADVQIKAGKNHNITIQADENIIKNISSSIKNGQLQVLAKKNFSTSSPIRLTIEMKDLDEIQHYGTGNISIDNVTNDKLGIFLAGTGDVYARGRADEMKARVDGSGNLNLQKLKVKDAYIHIEGMGNSFLDASNSINAKINGMGDIIYTGNPTIKRTGMGMGMVTRR